MKTLSEDTSPAVERMQLAIVGRMPAWRKLELIAGMNMLLTSVVMQGIEARQPDLDARARRLRLDEVRLGPDLARTLDWLRQGRLDTISRRGMGHMADNPIGSAPVAVIAALEGLGIPYYIGGSIASGVHGMYRATADMDIVADMREDQVDPFVRLLPNTLYADDHMIRDAIRHRSSFNVLDSESGFKVDVFISKGRPFERSQFERRNAVPLTALGERTIYVSSAEGTVLAKLEWYRKGGEISDRQWTDILSILKVKAADTDLAYLRHWAPIIGVADLLERALDDAGLQ